MNELVDIVIGLGTPILIVLGTILVGWIFKRFIHGYLKKFTKRTAFKTDDLLFEAIENQIIIWLGLAAIYYIAKTTEILSKYSENIVKALVFILIISIALAVNKFLIGMIDVWSAKQKRSLPSTKIFVKITNVTLVLNHI